MNFYPNCILNVTSIPLERLGRGIHASDADLQVYCVLFITVKYLVNPSDSNVLASVTIQVLLSADLKI